MSLDTLVELHFVDSGYHHEIQEIHEELEYNLKLIEDS